MRLFSRQYAEALLQSDSGDPKRIVSAFLSFVRKTRSMKRLPEIVRIAERLADKRDGRTALVVETARDTDQPFRTEIECFAAREFPGVELSFEYRVRPDLLGGVRISSDEIVVDATIRRRLKELELRIRN